MGTFHSGGKAIRIDHYEPSTPGPHPAILLLHGSGGNIGFWTDRIAPYLTGLNLALYTVHYFDRTGTTRATQAEILDGVHYPQWLATVGDALGYLRARPAVDANRIALLGISLGAFLALSLAAELANEPAQRVRAIVELSGGLPEPYASKATAAFPPTLILHGDADTVVPVSHAHALDTLLTRLNVPHQTEVLPNQGHWFDSAAQLRILMTTAQFLGRYL